jgi:hypothetical protein
MSNIEVLKGVTLDSIEGKVGDEEVIFRSGNRRWRMYHLQDCCEHVYLEDVVGDFSDLLGSPILLAEESSSNDDLGDDHDESCTWTFYRLATVRGFVTLRWYGSSNGYYSEGVDFEEI